MVKRHRLIVPIITIFSCLFAPHAFSVEVDQSETGRADSTVSALDSAFIDTVIVDNRNIYDLDDPRYRGFLFRAANKLHIATREQIVHREVLLKQKGLYLQSKAEETERNLRKRFPLNDAWIEVVPAGTDTVAVRVVTIDKWSLIGGIRSLRFEDNNDRYKFGFEERNLLGRAQFLSFDYFVEENSEDYVTSSFREPRAFGRPVSIELAYSSNPRGRIRAVALSHPFYNLDQRYSVGLSHANTGGLRELFDNGQEIARWENNAFRSSVSGTVRWGEDYRKLSLSMGYSYVSQQTRDTLIVDSSKFDSEIFPIDSVFHVPSIGLSYQKQDFVVLQRINGFEYREDFTLGFGASTSYSRALHPGFGNYHYDNFSIGVNSTQLLGSYLVQLGYSRSFWFREDESLRKLWTFSARAYNNKLKYLTMAIRSLYMSDISDNNNRLLIGGENGLRGYVDEAFAGDRYHIVNIEGRLFPGIEIISVKVGGALFVDLGAAWTNGSSLTLNDYHVSYGLGLRFSFEKLSRGELVRLELVRPSDGTWELQANSGQYF